MRERPTFKPTLMTTLLTAALGAACTLPVAAYADTDAPIAPLAQATGSPAATSSTVPSTTTAAKTATAPSTTLDTVVVTSQRRSENLQKESLAVTAVGSETLEKANITEISGLNGYVPGLLTERSSGSELMISIRGVGSETPQNLYTQPGVSVFIDGIYVPTSLGVAQGFLDVDRVEVLRGPQGTLFGQSSTGGAISIVSKQPVLGAFTGEVGTTYGTYDLNREFIGLNVPLGDTVAIRGVFQHEQNNGFANNSFFQNYRLDDSNDNGSKLALLWKPTPDLSATLTARYYIEDHNGAEQKNVNDPISDNRTVSQDTPAYYKLQYQIYGGTVQYELPFMTIKSVSGYQKMTSNQGIDDDRESGDQIGFYDAQPQWTSHSKVFTEEVNFISKIDGPLSWIGGVFYINNKTDQNIAEFRDAGIAPAYIPIPPITGPAPDNIAYEEFSKIKRETIAPFVQSTFAFTDAIRLTGGARYNHDKYTGDASFYYSPLAAVPNYSKGVWTGKAALETDITPDSLAYGSWTRGYKPGGINNAYDGSSVLVAPGFKTETVSSFELGSKNEFLDRTTRVNVAAFYSMYHNEQYLSSDPFPYQDGTSNIPKSRIWGGELEGAWLGFDHLLRIGGNLTWLGGRIDDHVLILDAQSASTARKAYEAANPGAGDFDPATVAAVAAAAQDAKGNKPPKLPRWSGSANATYTIAAGAIGTFMPRVEYVYRGSFNYRVFNESALDAVSPYGIVNLAVDYLPPVEGLRFTLAATNIGDKDGISGRFTDPYGSGQTSNQYIAPRQVMLSANYSF